MSDWLRAVYDDADGMDARAFAAHFTDSASFTLGNNPPMVGPGAIEEGLGGFFTTISGMKHAFTHTFTSGETTIMEAEVTYTLPSGAQVIVPGAAVVVRDGNRIAEMRSYIDLLPLFTADAAGDA